MGGKSETHVVVALALLIEGIPPLPSLFWQCRIKALLIYCRLLSPAIAFVLKQAKHRYTHCSNYNSPSGYRNAGQNQQNDSYEAEPVRWIKSRTEDGAGRPIVNKTNDVVDKQFTSVWLLLYGNTIVRLEIAALQMILFPCPDFRLCVLLWCELIFPDFENKFYLLH